MKTNIVFIGLLYEKNKKIAVKIAEDFDLYLADIADLLEYNLVNEEEIENTCGIDYLKKLKNKTIKEVATYENTLITIPYGLFVENENAELLKKYGTIVYLKFPKSVVEKHVKTITNEEKKLEAQLKLDMYDERNALCEQYCDVIIELKKYDYEFCRKQIEKLLNKYYL